MSDPRLDASRLDAALEAPLGRRAAIWLTVLGLAGIALSLVALAAGPQHVEGSDPAAHALSRSAVGYAGIVRLLRADGRAVGFVREPGRRPAVAGLLVLTPTPLARPDELRRLAFNRRVLLVAPKWLTRPAPDDPNRVQRVLVADGPLRSQLAALVPGAAGSALTVANGRDVVALRLLDTSGDIPASPSVEAGPVHGLRTVAAAALKPVWSTPEGGAVVSQGRGLPVFVLSDPDLLNNQGVADLRSARTAAALLEGLAGDGPIVFDLTLAGMGGGRSPLRLAFSAPFRGATLALALAAALAAWLALSRFGEPAAPERVYAFGKRALADGAASLLAFDRREPRLAGRFAELVRRQALAALGVPAQAAVAEDAALDRAAAAASREPWSTLASAPAPRTRAEATASARRLHDWKTEVTGGRG